MTVMHPPGPSQPSLRRFGNWGAIKQVSLRERFSDRARRVFRLANQEAQRLRHASVGAEHVLLGLFRDHSGVAAFALKNLRIDQAAISAEVERLIHPGMGTPVADNLPRAPDAERVIEYAIEEAQNLNHNYVGTEHILLGLLREKEGVAARVLRKFAVDLDEARAEITRILQQSADHVQTGDVLKSDIGTQTTEADMQFFLGLYRSAVDFYQPKIEKRTGVSLGKISIWDYGQLHCHVIRNLKRRLGFIRALLYRRRIKSYSESIGMTYADRSHNCGASYYRNAIYVSFASGTAHDYAIAELTVHELSHALWEKLEGVPLDENWRGAKTPASAEHEKFRLLIEGYAMYAQTIWFRDLYPACLRNNLDYARLDRKSIYFRGFQRIKELVEQSGQQVLLEIPQRWRSL
jgi:hypothetical protein